MESSVVQLGGVLVLAGLFVLLRRYMLRRAYFFTWTTAWLALSAALCAVVVRAILLEAFTGRRPQETDLAVRATYLAYQVAKLAMLVWLVDGTRVFASGRRGFARSRVLWAGVVAYAAASVTLSTGQAWVVVWQAPLAVTAFAWCARWLLTVPPTRRSPGAMASAAAFVYLAALWTVYALVFGIGAAVPAALPPLAAFIVEINPFLDLVGSIALGYGMILILVEDARREVDDAEAGLRAAHEGLRRAALHDPLTGIMNRSAFTEGLGLDMVRASFGTVVLLDLDNLKQVNDEFGHAGGDVLLRACADTLRRALGPVDRLYRWGGDEFLLVLPSARAAEVQPRLEEAIEEAPPVLPGPDGVPVRISASAGAADYTGYADLRAAIDRADAMMYRQKHARKRAAAAATPSLPTAAVRAPVEH